MRLMDGNDIERIERLRTERDRLKRELKELKGKQRKLTELLDDSLGAATAERDLAQKQLDRATGCISAIKKHQQAVAGTFAVHSTVMVIISKWEREELGHVEKRRKNNPD